MKNKALLILIIAVVIMAALIVSAWNDAPVMRYDDYTPQPVPVTPYSFQELPTVEGRPTLIPLATYTAEPEPG